MPVLVGVSIGISIRFGHVLISTIACRLVLWDFQLAFKLRFPGVTITETYQVISLSHGNYNNIYSVIALNLLLLTILYLLGSERIILELML